jgi:hypothetical protein
MGGGKETPRQKMISMMYIVLTALLALNVSKQILDAFVAIEANIQKGALTQLDRGDELRSDLTQELAQSKSEDEAAKRKKIEVALKTIADIDKETQVVIKNIDDAKLLLLEKLGELNPTPKDNDKDAILWVKYSANDPLRPSKLNLTALQSKDEFDTPMRELGIKELENIDKAGVGMKKVWEPYKNYRKRLVEICGTKKIEGKGFSVVLKGAVDQFADNKSLEKDVAKLIYKSNKPDSADVSELVTLYSELTKNELDDYGHDGDIQKDVHWLGRTFYHSPMIAAIASLSTLQYEVLAARAKAVGMIKSRISTGAYSFNKILGMAYPETAVLTPNEKFTVSVFMAAFDSDKQPQIIPNQGSIKEIKDGVALLDMTASGSGEMQITGRVGIADKMGTVKWKDYSTKVTIATKGGSLGLPETGVIYLDWDNKISYAAAGSGLKSTSVRSSVGTCVKGKYKGGDVYILKNLPKSAREVTVTLTGTDRNGNSSTYAQQKYKVRDFPKPEIKMNTVSRTSGGSITLGLPSSSPIDGVNFIITNGKILGQTFSGNRISNTLVRTARTNDEIGVTITYKRTDGKPGGIVRQSVLITP